MLQDCFSTWRPQSHKANSKESDCAQCSGTGACLPGLGAPLYLLSCARHRGARCVLRRGRKLSRLGGPRISRARVWRAIVRNLTLGVPANIARTGARAMATGIGPPLDFGQLDSWPSALAAVEECYCAQCDCGDCGSRAAREGVLESFRCPISLGWRPSPGPRSGRRLGDSAMRAVGWAPVDERGWTIGRGYWNRFWTTTLSAPARWDEESSGWGIRLCAM